MIMIENIIKNKNILKKNIIKKNKKEKNKKENLSSLLSSAGHLGSADITFLINEVKVT